MLVCLPLLSLPVFAGKTSYCHAMFQYLTGIGRKVVVVNLDPANDALPYPVVIDLKELIAMDEVMETFQLGPNGGLMYCIEYLEKNIGWLKKKIREHDGQPGLLGGGWVACVDSGDGVRDPDPSSFALLALVSCVVQMPTSSLTCPARSNSTRTTRA